MARTSTNKGTAKKGGDSKVTYKPGREVKTVSLSSLNDAFKEKAEGEESVTDESVASVSAVPAEPQRIVNTAPAPITNIGEDDDEEMLERPKTGLKTRKAAIYVPPALYKKMHNASIREGYRSLNEWIINAVIEHLNK